jgi:hypothetical protein
MDGVHVGVADRSKREAFPVEHRRDLLDAARRKDDEDTFGRALGIGEVGLPGGA